MPKQFDPDKIEIHEMRREEIGELARFHEEMFREYFLTALGPTFLYRFFREFLYHPTSHAFLARDKASGRIVGYVAGAGDTQRHFRLFYRRNAALFIPLLVWRFFVNSMVRQKVWRRTAHLKTALRSLLPGQKGGSKPISDTGPQNLCQARMLGHAVDPEYRGGGVAAALVDEFMIYFKRDGFDRVGHSTQPTNARTIGFYKKIGWRIVHQNDTGVWFEKET